MEGQQRREQRVAALLAEPEAGDAGAGLGGDRVEDIVQGAGSGDRSWSSRWTPRRRRLAEKPISRSAGRSPRPFPMRKSRVSLMVVSVLSARPSLWYCFTVVCL